MGNNVCADSDREHGEHCKYENKHSKHDTEKSRYTNPYIDRRQNNNHPSDPINEGLNAADNTIRQIKSKIATCNMHANVSNSDKIACKFVCVSYTI